MPLEVEYIDAIARRVQRDVLTLAFAPAGAAPAQVPGLQTPDYEQMPSRRHILAWLDQEGYAWQRCGGIASERVMRPYAGQIYIDLPYDPADDRYQRLQQFLEHDDGAMRFEDVDFCVVTLAFAMQNSHHDEPGFWERWADQF